MEATEITMEGAGNMRMWNPVDVPIATANFFSLQVVSPCEGHILALEREKEVKTLSLIILQSRGPPTITLASANRQGRRLRYRELILGRRWFIHIT